MNWGGKFLKKMWCFFGGGCGKVIVFSSEWTIRSDEGLTLETSAFLSFTVANLRFKLSC